MSVLLPDCPVESAEWFALRAAGVTASEMELIGRGTPGAFAQVAARKRGTDSFHGNAYTDWGREREKPIAEHLRFLYGIEPTDRIYQSDVDPRWLASPDGVGPMLAEIKTTGTDWPVRVDGIPRHYYDQVQWAQMVCDATETVFAWEVRLGAPGGFVPGPIRHVVIPRDQNRINELVVLAERFWEYYQAGETGEWDDLIGRWADMETRVAELAAERAELDAAIRARAGDQDLAVKSPLGSISLAYPKPRRGFDTARFKTDHADLYGQYETTTPAAKRTLRVSTKEA